MTVHREDFFILFPDVVVEWSVGRKERRAAMNRATRRAMSRQVAFLALLLVGIFMSTGCQLLEAETSLSPSGELTVHFIDVDQGDATLLEGPDFTVLIDAGRHDRTDVVPYLQAAGVDRLDLLVGTHPHADHIGQMDEVIAQFPVDEVWMSGATHTSKTFERVVDAILDSEATYYEPRAGETFQIGSLRLEVIHPEELPEDLNNGSIVIRAVYGQIVFLFTGDAEKEAEKEMLERGHVLNAHILHMGHHGSSTSSTPEFVEAVSPEVAIYSAGKDNEYGHPHQEVLQRLADLNIPVYGTDQHGTIRVVTDGSTYSVEAERN